MSLDLNVFVGNGATRKFRFVPSTTTKHQSWATLSQGNEMGRFVTSIHRQGTSEDCARGQGPFIEFQLDRIGRVATTGISNIDQFICTQISHWRELDQLNGKLHVVRGGIWLADRDTRSITIKGACLAFTHRKKNCEPSLGKLTNPRPWGLGLAIIREGNITLTP